MDQNLAVLWGEQADPKSLGGGPKPILRTGVLPLSLMVFSTSPPRPPLAPPSEDQQYHELSPYATVLLDSRPAARPSMPAPSQQHITTSRHQEPARQAAWCQDSNRQSDTRQKASSRHPEQDIWHHPPLHCQHHLDLQTLNQVIFVSLFVPCVHLEMPPFLLHQEEGEGLYRCEEELYAQVLPGSPAAQFSGAPSYPPHE